MKTKELIEIILKSNQDGFKLTNISTMSDKYKKTKVFEFQFISDALEFLDLEKKFNYYNNMNLEDIKKHMQDYGELGKKLNILKEKLKLNSAKYNLIKADFYDVKPINIIPNSALDAISDFILLGLSDFIFNNLSATLINTKLNKEFIINTDEFADIYCNFISFSDGVYRVKDGYKGFKIFIKEYDLLAKVYKTCGKEGLDKLSRINDLICKNNNLFFSTNLIDSVFGYKLLSNCNDIEFENKKEDLILQDIVSKNGEFKSFDEEDIANIIISFFKKNHTYGKIVSCNENEAFKDLSPLLSIIERRKKDLYSKKDIKLLIENVSNGLINLDFKEKENHMSKKLL